MPDEDMAGHVVYYCDVTMEPRVFYSIKMPRILTLEKGWSIGIRSRPYPDQVVQPYPVHWSWLHELLEAPKCPFSFCL